MLLQSSHAASPLSFAPLSPPAGPVMGCMRVPVIRVFDSETGEEEGCDRLSHGATQC
jgi:hypothetical protein